jgi:hypothetical protein
MEDGGFGMKQESIKNEYDGPRRPEKRLPSGHFSLDYINSDNADEIDLGIRETIKGVRLSILAVGIGLAKIKAQGLYIGEAYLKYRKELEKVGFSDEDGPTKLPYVDRALALYQKKEVFRAVKDMSLWQFISFTRRRLRHRCWNRISGSGGTRSTSGTG